MMQNVNLSYWDERHVSKVVDLLIVGAGITGLSSALRVQQLRPDLTIRIVDKHHITRVASTRNAGFACFGSLTEILDDIHHFGEEVALDLVKRRFKGVELIRKTFQAAMIEYHHTGGYELLDGSRWSLKQIRQAMNEINALLRPVCDANVFSLIENPKSMFPFAEGVHVVYNPFEGQLNPAAFVSKLANKLHRHTAEVFAGIEVKSVILQDDLMHVITSWGNMRARQVVLATNALTESLGLSHKQIRPARNIVLVSEPLDLNFKGVFHAEKGYIYFRNIGNRLLIGGGRHWHKDAEYVSDFGNNQDITERLKSYVGEIILPHRTSIDYPFQWSGIMGMTADKRPILEKLSEKLFLAAGFGGMGVALGMHSGFKIAELACKENFN